MNSQSRLLIGAPPLVVVSEADPYRGVPAVVYEPTLRRISHYAQIQDACPKCSQKRETYAGTLIKGPTYPRYCFSGRFAWFVFWRACRKQAEHLHQRCLSCKAGWTVTCVDRTVAP